MTEVARVTDLHRRPEGGTSKLAHFADQSSLLDQLESRRLERRGLDRRGDGDRGHYPAATEQTLLARQLCHDMRQPLAAIAAITAVLDPEPGLSVTGRQRLEQLLEQTQRLSSFVAGCLTAPQQVAVDLRRVLDAVVRSGSVVFEGTLQLAGSDEPVVRGDAVLLDRALTNVLDNACQAAGPDGLVRVALWSAPDGAYVDIDDDGPGFGRSAPRGGHGLGLGIAQSVLDQHGGSLHTGPGVLGGTRVRIRLPLVIPTQVGPCLP